MLINKCYASGKLEIKKFRKFFPKRLYLNIVNAQWDSVSFQWDNCTPMKYPNINILYASFSIQEYKIKIMRKHSGHSCQKLFGEYDHLTIPTIHFSCFFMGH